MSHNFPNYDGYRLTGHYPHGATIDKILAHELAIKADRSQASESSDGESSGPDAN